MTYTNKALAGIKLPAGFTVTAHSGAFGTPDNSLEFIEKALAERCDIIEMDVTFRPGGLPVIIHSGNPAEDEGVPLEEAFCRIAANGTARMNLDLKSTANLPAVDALLQKYGLTERAFYTGVEETTAPTVQKNSTVPYYINHGFSYGEKRSKAAAEAAAKKIIALGAIGLNSHYGSVSPTVARAMRENGLPVSVWTANSPAAMRRCIALAPDNITTRHPDALRIMLSLTAGIEKET